LEIGEFSWGLIFEAGNFGGIISPGEIGPGVIWRLFLLGKNFPPRRPG